jgi:RNA polymerase sigma-70 factor, ECF subfamily
MIGQVRSSSLAATSGRGKIKSNELHELRDRLSPDATRALSRGGGSAVPLRDIDSQLIDRCLRKEPGAWNDFVDRYMGLIYHVIHHVSHARSLTLSPPDIEDIAAEVFLGIVDDDYGVLRRFRGNSSLPTYLTVVARRICVKEVIKRQREAELGHLNAHRAIVDEESAGHAEAIASAEEVEQMLENLSDREAEVVRLYHLRYLNYRQIGKQLSIPENSVGPILTKARQHLRRSAEQRNSTEHRNSTEQRSAI